MNRTRYSEAQISEKLTLLAGWAFDGAQIYKLFEFPSYASGLAFVSGVGYLADKLDHHPDLFVGYRKVKVGLNTHDADGITDFDFALAQQIEALS